MWIDVWTKIYFGRHLRKLGILREDSGQPMDRQYKRLGKSFCLNNRQERNTNNWMGCGRGWHSISDHTAQNCRGYLIQPPHLQIKSKVKQLSWDGTPGMDFKILWLGIFLVIQWLRLCTPNAGDPGSIPGQRTRSHMLQLRSGTVK